jgi:hypothetical protein
MVVELGQLASGILDDKWILNTIPEALAFAIDEHLSDGTYLIWNEAGDSRPATDAEFLRAVLEILEALNAGHIDDSAY